jgi:hypothetical protein
LSAISGSEIEMMMDVKVEASLDAFSFPISRINQVHRTGAAPKITSSANSKKNW